VRLLHPRRRDGVPVLLRRHVPGWGKLIAANGVAVVMVDFRNAVVPSSVPEVAAFPAGLNDCVSGLKWVIANAPTSASTRAG